MMIGSFWWRTAITYAPYAWRDWLVPGWTELRAFVDAWMQAPPDTIGRPAALPVEGDAPVEVPPLPTLIESPPLTRSQVAYRHLGGNALAAMKLRFALQCIGSFTKAFALVHRGRPLTDEEKQRFATHAMPADKVDWQHIASGTAGLLGALFMMPNGVEE